MTDMQGRGEVVGQKKPAMRDLDVSQIDRIGAGGPRAISICRAAHRELTHALAPWTRADGCIGEVVRTVSP